MGKFFKSPIGFTGIFMGGKYILFIAVVFSITCTACSEQKEKTGGYPFRADKQSAGE